MPEEINQTTGEITNVPAVATRAPSIADILRAKGVTIVKQVTRTVLQQRDDVPFCVRFEAPIRESEVQEGTGRGGKPKMAAARVADVLEYVVTEDGEIEAGSRKILIANTVMEGELNRNYPNNGFVGKAFLMKSYFPEDKNAQNGKKSYKVYEIIEVDIPDDGTISGVAPVADGSDPVNKDGKTKK